MSNLIIEQIERRARLEHGGDFAKAATEFFRDHPERYKDAVTVVNKRGGVDRERVNGEIQYRVALIAHRDHLDLHKPADRLAAQVKVFAEDPALHKRYTAANTVRVGKISLTD